MYVNRDEMKPILYSPIQKLYLLLVQWIQIVLTNFVRNILFRI